MVSVSSAENIPKTLPRKTGSLHIAKISGYFFQNETALLQIFLCFISLKSSWLIVLTLCFDQEGECMLHLSSLYTFQTTSESELFSSYWHKMSKKITQPTTKETLTQESRRKNNLASKIRSWQRWSRDASSFSYLLGAAKMSRMPVTMKNVLPGVLQDLQMVKWDDSSIARKKSHVLWHSRRQLDRKIKTRKTRVLVPHLTDYCKQQHCLAQSQLGLQQDRTSATVQGHLEGCHLWEGEFKLGWGQKTA